jgi:hypothetical protein
LENSRILDTSKREENMKTTYLLVLALLVMSACKKEPEEPSLPTPHKISLGVKVNTAATSMDGIKTINIVYSGAQGAFTLNRVYSDSLKPFPQTWDTTFDAYNGGTIKYTVGVTSYNLKMYSYDGHTKTDTTFKVAEPDKVNSLEISVKD